ncbi:MAG: DUF2851 family protein, partial [Verrucomicrobia bacterium]|nr:DUF2851 family protein [Verrucomicrobiota bacterium]
MATMYAEPSIPEAFFPRAVFYRKLIFPSEVRETAGRYFPYSERHLHALWFDDRLRPQNLKTSRGEPVTVENPGRWNLEAGPDFFDAVLLIGRERRRVAGDAEVHIFSNDWKNHGHSADPRYAGVRFHITWFAGKIDESIFPPGTVHISLADGCSADLESIDLSAYPYHEPRASADFPMFGKSPDEIFQTLECAGEERLRQKTQRMAWLIQRRGEAQALYEEVSAALGYKHNKAPFRMLAQRLPLEALAQYGSDWKTIYAVLLGLSGLLPKQPTFSWPDASKKELRSLWDCWWREQHKWEEVEPLDKSDWRLAGVRPLNHPVRRLCALAQYATTGSFQTLEESFWSQRIGWTGKEKRAELVGKDRLTAIELNVFVPYRLAKGDASALENLPVEPMNSVIRETAYTLFGPDHSPKLYRTALAR